MHPKHVLLLNGLWVLTGTLLPGKGLCGMPQAPESIAAKLNSKLDLECKSQYAVHCIWKLNGGNMVVGGLAAGKTLHWKSGSEGKEKQIPDKDCSIQIESISEKNFGIWSCYGRSGSQVTGLREYSLVDANAPPPELKFVIEPKDTSWLGVNDKISLDCRITVPSTCIWTQNGKYPNQETRKRLRYRDEGERNKAGSKNCSITIESPLQAVDAGMWRCHTANNSKRNGISSRKAKVSIKPSPEILSDTEMQKTASVLDGPVDLLCKFTDSVNCIWKKDDKAVEMSSRISLVRGTGEQRMSDCSIRIQNLGMSDSGNWRCGGRFDDYKETVFSEKEIALTVTSPCDEKSCNEKQHCVLIDYKPICICSSTPTCDPNSGTVCGSNDETYKSECEMYGAHCDITIKNSGECATAAWIVPLSVVLPIVAILIGGGICWWRKKKLKLNLEDPAPIKNNDIQKREKRKQSNVEKAEASRYENSVVMYEEKPPRPPKNLDRTTVMEDLNSNEHQQTDVKNESDDTACLIVPCSTVSEPQDIQVEIHENTSNESKSANNFEVYKQLRSRRIAAELKQLNISHA